MDDENIMDVDYSFNRLGPCEVCGGKEAKYTCPKCEVKTCCLKCVRIHKKELNCDGIRDKTKFIKLNSFTNLDLLSDYRLLEEVTRSVEKCKRDKLRQYRKENKELPLNLYRLRAAATRREMILKFLPKQFTRRKSNTTFLDWKTQIIHWKIEWIFPAAENLKLIDERCSENDKVGLLLNKYFEPESLDTVLAEKLKFYHSTGLNGIEVLLKAEEKRGNKFYHIDISKTLRECLKYKIIIENPTMIVIFKSEIEAYELIDSEDEREKADLEEQMDKSNALKRLTNIKIEREKRKKRKNLLLTTEYSSDEISDSSSSEESSASDIKIPKRMFL